MRRRWLVAPVVLLGVLASLAVYSALPSTYGDYREVALSSAQEALSGVRLLAIVAAGDEGGRLPSPYRGSLLTDAHESLVSAGSALAEEPVPDERSRALRDQVQPLLAEAVRLEGDLELALDRSDRPGAAAAVAKLTGLGDRLAALVNGARS